MKKQFYINHASHLKEDVIKNLKITSTYKDLVHTLHCHLLKVAVLSKRQQRVKSLSFSLLISICDIFQ